MNFKHASPQMHDALIFIADIGHTRDTSHHTGAHTHATTESLSVCARTRDTNVVPTLINDGECKLLEDCHTIHHILIWQQARSPRCAGRGTAACDYRFKAFGAGTMQSVAIRCHAYVAYAALDVVELLSTTPLSSSSFLSCYSHVSFFPLGGVSDTIAKRRRRLRSCALAWLASRHSSACSMKSAFTAGAGHRAAARS